MKGVLSHELLSACARGNEATLSNDHTCAIESMILCNSGELAYCLLGHGFLYVHSTCILLARPVSYTYIAHVYCLLGHGFLHVHTTCVLLARPVSYTYILHVHVYCLLGHSFLYVHTTCLLLARPRFPIRTYYMFTAC